MSNTYLMFIYVGLRILMYHIVVVHLLPSNLYAICVDSNSNLDLKPYCFQTSANRLLDRMFPIYKCRTIVIRSKILLLLFGQNSRKGNNSQLHSSKILRSISKPL